MAHKNKHTRMKIQKVDISENVSWILQKSCWCMHMVFTIMLKLTLYIFFTENKSWQLTLILYNLITFYLFHWKVGDPFCRDYYNYTLWEQIVEQSEDTLQVRFLALYPAILFIVFNKFIDWKTSLFYFYILTLMMVVIPKLSFMHLRRIFGCRSYN